MAMMQPNSRRRPQGHAQPEIDWQAALAQHGGWLRTVVRARLGEPQAVDEVMQEVSLAAVESRSPLADPSKVAPWLYRLAVIQSLLYRRNQGRRRKLTDRYARRLGMAREVATNDREFIHRRWLAPRPSAGTARRRPGTH